MKLELKGNPNYSAEIVVIKDIIDLQGCDNIKATMILGNHVIVSKDTKIGDIGIFFPVETKIESIFLSANNLYRDKELNVDKTKSGFFEYKGRVRAMSLRGYKSQGFFIPVESLSFIIGKEFQDKLKEGTSFDTIDGQLICQKYIVNTQTQGSGKIGKQQKRLKRISKLIDGQFRFHIDTLQFGRNIHKLSPDTLLSITLKVHGTSAISSKILIKRKLNIIEKFLKKVGVKIQDTEYSNIYASRKVLKNQYEEGQKNHQHYYSVDLWGDTDKVLQPYIDNGMTLYYEIVGYIPNSTKFIQKPFDYGCKEGEYKIYIYRITYTNNDGKVFEFSMHQVQEWCKLKGLNAVPLLFYGTVRDYFYYKGYDTITDDRNWRDKFLKDLTDTYLEKDSVYCMNQVPEEGIVIRPEKLEIDSYKLKAHRFYEFETKMIDAGENDIEENQGE